MNNKKILLPAFLVVVIIQLFVPAQLIYDQEMVLRAGTTFKFKSAPIDPTDPFRGKYITLGFEDNTVGTSGEEKWQRGEPAYITIATDQDGFAVPVAASKTRPSGSEDYLKVMVRYAYDDQLVLDYPFNRYYMEETKAKPAEEAYREGVFDKVTYALVNIKDGNAVLKGVMIDDRPIEEVIE